MNKLTYVIVVITINLLIVNY